MPGARFAAHAIGQVAAPGAGLEDRGDAVEGVAIEHVEQVLAGVVVGGKARSRAVAHMHVIVDQRRHDGLAGEIDARRARRRRQLAAPSDAGDPVIGDDEGGVLDDAAVAGEKACTLVEGDGRRLGPATEEARPTASAIPRPKPNSNEGGTCLDSCRCFTPPAFRSEAGEEKKVTHPSPSSGRAGWGSFFTRQCAWPPPDLALARPPSPKPGRDSLPPTSARRLHRPRPPAPFRRPAAGSPR